VAQHPDTAYLLDMNQPIQDCFHEVLHQSAPYERPVFLHTGQAKLTRSLLRQYDALRNELAPATALLLLDHLPGGPLLSELRQLPAVLPIAVYLPSDQASFYCDYRQGVYQLATQLELLRRLRTAVGPVTVLSSDPSNIHDNQHFIELIATQASELYFLSSADSTRAQALQTALSELSPS
jgi:hypothetical protein